jgi:Flp pilus assembly pilin Flp
MRNKRVATLVVSVLVVVLVAVCIVAAGPVLMDTIRSIHVIPPH